MKWKSGLKVTNCARLINLCCSSESISNAEKEYVHFYFAVKAILHKLTKGDAPDTAQMNDYVRE